MEPLETTIRRHLTRYLAGDTSLDAFIDWFVGVAWTIEESGGPEARELTYAIELALAEASSGLLTPQELRAELEALSRQPALNLDPR